MFELIVEIGRIHQRKRHPRDRVFGEQRVNIFRHQARTAQAHRLDGEAFGLQPFGQQRDLGGAAGAVHALNYDQRAAEFLIIHARKGQSVVASGRSGRRGSLLEVTVSAIGPRFFHRGLRAAFLGAKRDRSMRDFTM